MYIDSLGGTAQYSQFQEYREQISRIIQSGEENEIHIYSEESIDGWDEDCPCTLSILVKDGRAVVNYFSEGNEDLFASIGDLEKDGSVEWQIGSEVYSAAEYQIISLEKALECALQFFTSQEKPDCIAWEEL